MKRTERSRCDLVLGGVATAILGLLAFSPPAAAQTIADRIAAVRDGQVRMSFTARPGVCGSGRNISTSRESDDWESRCEGGPVRVALDIVAGVVTDVDTYVGGRWRSPRATTTDLGADRPHGTPEELFDLGVRVQSYDYVVAPDGQSFVAIMESADTEASAATVIMRWDGGR